MFVRADSRQAGFDVAAEPRRRRVEAHSWAGRKGIIISQECASFQPQRRIDSGTPASLTQQTGTFPPSCLGLRVKTKPT